MIGIILYDKLLHFLVNYLLITSVGIFNIYIAMILAVICSFGKELFDQIKYKGFDWWDILADVLGMLFGLLIVLCN